MQSHGEPVPYRLPLRRLFWLPLGLTFLLVLVVLAGLVAVSWRGLERIRPVQAHLAHIARVQDLGLAIEETLIKGLRGARIDPAELARLHREVRQIAAEEGLLHPHAHERLERVTRLLERAPADPKEVLSETLAELRQVLVGERDHHEQLLFKVATDTAEELRLALFLLVALPLGVLAGSRANSAWDHLISLLTLGAQSRSKVVAVYDLSPDLGQRLGRLVPASQQSA